MNRSDIVYFNQTDALKNSIIDQRSRYDNKGFNYRAYVSWVEPIGHNNFIQATYSISQRKQEALKNVYNQDADGIYNVLDSAYSQSYRSSYGSSPRYYRRRNYLREEYSAGRSCYERHCRNGNNEYFPQELVYPA